MRGCPRGPTPVGNLRDTVPRGGDSAARAFLGAASLLLLAGCAGGPAFRISGDVFESGIHVVSTEGNRLSHKSAIPYLILSDTARADRKAFPEQGLYLDPYVMRDSGTGAVIRLGFRLIHLAADAGTAFQPIHRIDVLLDGRQILTLPVRGQHAGVYRRYNHWKGLLLFSETHREISTLAEKVPYRAREVDVHDRYYQETGLAEATREQLRRLAGASAIEVRVEGGEGWRRYAGEDVSGAFLVNLRSFLARLERDDAAYAAGKPPRPAQASSPGDFPPGN